MNSTMTEAEARHAAETFNRPSFRAEAVYLTNLQQWALRIFDPSGDWRNFGTLDDLHGWEQRAHKARYSPTWLTTHPKP